MQRSRNTNQVERRQYKRFAVKDVAFAVLKTDQDEELGQIVNVSMGGLAFQYFVGNREFTPSHRLDMLLADNQLHVDNIVFNLVEDQELVNELPFSSITKRQQRVCFKNLTEKQKAGIRHFIQNHTCPE